MFYSLGILSEVRIVPNKFGKKGRFFLGKLTIFREEVYAHTLDVMCSLGGGFSFLDR